MAFKADKYTLKTRDTMVLALKEKREEMDAALEAYNAAISPLSADLRTAIDEYNSILFDVRAFVEEFATEMQSEFEERSERWQEGERGEVVSGWISELESQTDFEDIDFEEPQGIVIDAPDHSELLDDLQLEPEF
jgi:hypothetical protein